MISVTIVCLKRDIDIALNALNEFGNFHIEETRSLESESCRALIEEAERNSARLNAVMERLKIKRQIAVRIFEREVRREKLQVDDWVTLLKNVSKEISDLEEEVNKAFESLKRINQKTSELQRYSRILEILERFNIDPRALRKLRLIYTIVATVPIRHVIGLERAISNIPVIYYHEEISDERAFVFLATTIKNRQLVERIIRTYDVKPFPDIEMIDQKPSQALSSVRKQLRELSEKREEALKLIQTLSSKYRARLLALREIVWNIENALKVKEKVLKTKRLVQISGYVPEPSFHLLEKYMKKSLGDNFILLSSNHGKSEDPPTALLNPPFVKPFEMITKLYGLPHYDEVDPTPAMAVTFPLIFGLMFGDLGHGAILFLGGLLLSFMIKYPKEWREFCKILAACGLGSILAGLLFGEAFGRHVFTPLWLDPFDNVITFLTFSLLVGVLQIMTGFVLNFVNFMLRGECINALTVSLPKIIFYGLAVYLLMEFKLNFDLWLSGPIFYLSAALFFLIFGKPIFTLISRKGEFIHVLSERLFEGSEFLLSLLSNTMSYARILALLMAHWALLTATYAISDLASTIPMFGQTVEWIMIIGGNIFVMAFEGLIVFIHTLRLHFYEWFSKFYEGTGTAFQPYKYRQEYVEIEVLPKRRNTKVG